MKTLMKKLKPRPEDNIVIYSLKALIRRYTIDNLSQLGGQLAYFAILSLFPFLILINQVISMLNLKATDIFGEFYNVFPPNVAFVVDNYLYQIEKTDHTGIFTVGILITLWLASSAVTSLFHSLNKAFRREKPISPRKRLLSYAFTTVVLILIFVSIILSSISENLLIKVVTFFNWDISWVTIWNVLRWFIPIALLVFIIVILYRIIAPRKFSKRCTLVGALFAVCCLLLMTLALSFYTSNLRNFSIVYGSLGTIVILLLYLYWSGIIIVLGGELAHILEMRRKKNYSYDCE